MTPFIKQGKSILGPGIPVVGNGRLTSPDDMVALIRAGVLDIIGAARPSIADPVPADQDLRGTPGGYPRVHRLQHLRLEVPAGRPDHVHAEPDHRRGVPPRLAPREIHPDDEALLRAGGRRRTRRHGMRARLGERGYTVHLREAESELGGHWNPWRHCRA